MGKKTDPKYVIVTTIGQCIYLCKTRRPIAYADKLTPNEWFRCSPIATVRYSIDSTRQASREEVTAILLGMK